jgi:hypothetical protein
MPEAVIEKPESQTETFTSFRGGRGASAEVVPAKPEKPNDDSSAASQPEDQSTSKESQEGAAPKAETASDADPKQDKVAKRKDQIQREIDDLVKQREALKREVRPVEQLKPSAEAPRPAATFDGTDKDDPEPKAESYDNWQKFADERAAWVARNTFRRLEHEKAEKFKADQAKSQSEAIAKQSQEDYNDFVGRGEDFAKEHPDYRELFAEITKRPSISRETALVCTYAEDDLGPAVLYDLMIHPEKLEEIEKMPRPTDRLNALYALKHEIIYARKEAAKPPTEEKPRSSAPRPGTVLNGSGGQGSSEPKNFSQFRKLPVQKRYA